MEKNHQRNTRTFPMVERYFSIERAYQVPPPKNEKTESTCRYIFVKLTI